MMVRQAQKDFERPILTVDVVLFALFDGKLHVLLPARETTPFHGYLALVGGYIHTQTDKDTHAAARRVLSDKVKISVPYLEQLAVFSGADRDPRGWSATIAYLSMIKDVPKALRKDFHPIDRLPRNIAFDHEIIIHWAVQRIRNKVNYSSLPLLIMSNEFTLFELQNVYEMLIGTKIDTTYFRRKIREVGVIEQTGKMSDPQITHTRPAELFRAKHQTLWLFDDSLRS